MPIRLHDTLARYFSAASAHDAEAMSALFASAAVVRDEGREHRGLEAIRRCRLRACELCGERSRQHN